MLARKMVTFWWGILAILPELRHNAYMMKVWSLVTFELLFNVHAHRGSVLCLYLSADGKLLFSSAGDAIVNVRWPNLRVRKPLRKLGLVHEHAQPPLLDLL